MSGVEASASVVPASANLTVDGALRAVGLGPALDTPIAEVLRSLRLPPLPALPPVPPLPGLPPLPVLDLGALLKPLTDLLGAFGTGDLAGAGDLGKVFSGLSELLDLTISGTTSVLKAVDTVWAGTAATTAATKMGRTAAETGVVSQQGAAMSVDIGAAGTIVAGGLAALQAVIAKTVGLLSAAMVFIWTPPGQAAALAAISAGIAEGAAVVAATKAQLLAPTATMVAHGAPVPISGAPAGALSPFAIAASALEAAAVPLKTATGVLGSALAAASSSNTGSAKTTPSVDNRDGRRDATPEPCCPADAHKVGAAGVGGAHTRGLGGAGQGGGASVGGLGDAGNREVTARYAARTAGLGGTEPAGAVAASTPAPSQAGVLGSGGTVAPMAGVGAMGGAHAVGRVIGGSPVVLKSPDAVAECERACAPAVFGDDGRPSAHGPDDTGLGPVDDAAAARLAALREELLS